MRGDAALQVQKPCQPLALGLAEPGDGDEIIGAANHRADGDDHHIDEGIDDLAAPRIREFREMVRDPNRLGLRHGMGPGARDLHDPCRLATSGEIASAQS